MKIQKWSKKKIAEKAASNGLSVGQQKDQDKRLRIIKEKQLTSQMNDSKWRKVIQAISDIKGYAPHFRVRCLDQEESPENTWDGSFPYHVPTFHFIEWIEFKPDVETGFHRLKPSKKVDFKKEIIAALNQANVPISITKTGIRINAYLGSEQK